MRGMDAGPGTDLGGLGWFLGIWLTMTAAMMLPSSALMVLAYARASPTARAGSFVFGYLVAWTAYGLGCLRRLPASSRELASPGSTGIAVAPTSQALRSRPPASTSSRR